MASRPGPSQPQIPKAQSSVRRNLFHGSLSRRPTSATSTSTSATTYIESPYDVSTEIVVRDRNGNYQISMPALPPAEDDPLPNSQKRAEDGVSVEHDTGSSRYVVAEDPAERHAATLASLRLKVENLEDDKWMYEAEIGIDD